MLIEFLGETETYAAVTDPPVPARDLLPAWYQQLPSYGSPDGSTHKQAGTSGHYNSTAKHCMPILDVMSAGYVLTVPQDLHVLANTDQGVETAWPMDDLPLIESHPNWQLSTYDLGEEWSPAVLKLINRWMVRTPPGYSTLFLHPVWRAEHRFQVFSGLVDTDEYPQCINFPFLLRRNFVGCIAAGTPFVQLIPVRRDEWEHRVGVRTQDQRVSWLRATRQSMHRYKSNFRQPKRWK